MKELVGRASAPARRSAQAGKPVPPEELFGTEMPDLPHQALDEGLVEAVGRGQDRAPQLEDDPPGFTQVVLS